MEAILRRAGYAIAGNTDDPAAAHELVVRKRPNVALVDVSLPGGDGIELAKPILRDRPEQPILLYTGFENDPRLESVLSIGVKGVALKAGAPQELVDAIVPWHRTASTSTPASGRHSPGRAARSAPSASRPASERSSTPGPGVHRRGHRHPAGAVRRDRAHPRPQRHARNGMRRLGARTRAYALAIALTSGEIDVSRPGDEAPAGSRSSSGSSQTPA